EKSLRDEIQRRGPVSFQRFMEVALYGPGCGYYESAERVIGRAGDFYTSVSVGPVFGFLLASWCARQFADFDRIDFIETAAHDARLARDILAALHDFHPETAARLHYRIVEPSPVRRGVQERALAAESFRVTWHAGLHEVPRPVRGVIFANELLDAFPVQLFEWDATTGRRCARGVPIPHGALAWCRSGPAGPVELPPELRSILPDRFLLERCPAADEWWRTAARLLGTGVLLTFDYGFEDELPVFPTHPEGTLRAYSRHRLSTSILASPGDQDLTAHVQLGRLRRIGEEEGLVTEALMPQGRWLGRIAAGILEQSPPAAEWLLRHARQLQ